MENRFLMQDVVEKWGEEAQLDSIVDHSLYLASSLLKFKKADHKEDHLSYSVAYNDVCERIAEMRLMVEQAEFLFNTTEINNHYQNKVHDLKEALKVIS